MAGIFVHDYLPLILQEVHGLKMTQGEPGFCDAVVSLIGQRVSAASHSDKYALTLSFGEGPQFVVRSNASAISGPEAFQFTGENQPPVVEQND